MALALYDPSSVVIYIAGISLEDVAEGTFVRISKDTQTFSSSTSTDGQVYRKRSSSASYTLTLSLTSSSKSNRVLQYLLIADYATSLGTFPILIKDTSGSSLFFSTNGWIESQPDMNFDQGVRTLTWTIRCLSPTITYGDSYGSSSTGEDIVQGIISSIPSLTGLL